MWMTPTWTQPLETASQAQKQTRCPYKLPTRSTRRGYGLPVDWAKAVSGWRLNDRRMTKGSVTVTRMCGDMTIRGLEQCRIALLWKSTTSLRCEKWQSGLTNCSKFYTRESEAETHGRAKTLVLSLKQYHAHYYWFYEKWTTRAMAGLQGLHMSDTFQCCNVSARVGI